MKTNRNETRGKRNAKGIYGITALIICAAIILFLASCSASPSQKLENAQKSLDEGNYEAAIEESQDALKDTDDPVEIYKVLAKAALMNGDEDLARETYQKLYEATKDEAYQTILNYIGYGNIGSNIINGGNVTEFGETVYYLQQLDSQTDFWKINGEEATKINDFSLIDAESSGAPVKDLNVWEKKLYFIYKNSIYWMDLGTGELKAVVSPDSSDDLSNPNGSGFPMDNLQIYKGRMYFVKDIPSSNTAPNILSCSLDGTDQKVVYHADDTYNRFFIANDTIYVIQTPPGRESFSVLSLNPETSETKQIYSGQNQYIMSAAISGDELIYNVLTIEPGSATPPNFGNDIYSLNLTSGEVKTLASPGNVSALNVGGGKLYYVSSGAFYSAELDGSSPTKIGDAPTSSTLVRMGQVRNSICIANDSVYVTTSNVEDVYDIYGKGAVTFKVPFNNPQDYKNADEELSSASDETNAEGN